MPSLAEPFDGVLTEKDWSKARDKTGLTGSLTEKVSMGKELTLFHKTKDEPAATHLLGKIGLYEQVLKAKHSKDKYYAKLLALVTQQREAVQLGINILTNVPVINDLRKRLRQITVDGPSMANRIKNETQTKANEKAFQERYDAIAARVNGVLKEVPEGAYILSPTAVEAVVHLENDVKQFKADLDKEATGDDDDEAGSEGGATTEAGKYWEQTMIPYITGLINSVLSKNPDLMLKVQPTQVIAGLMGGIRTKFESTFDRTKIKPFGKDHRPEPNDKTTSEAVTSALSVLLAAAKATMDRKTDTEWFQYAPLPENTKTGTGGKDVAFTGTSPEQFDDQKAYGSLLTRLAGLATDPAAAAKFLSNVDHLKVIFPYELSDGRKETDPSKKIPSVVTRLTDLGIELSRGIDNVRRSLGEQPPGIEAARATFGQLEQAVDGLQLPRHRDAVHEGVKRFILKPLGEEITAAQGK
jgi:hypothetical protein